MAKRRQIIGHDLCAKADWLGRCNWSNFRDVEELRKQEVDPTNALNSLLRYRRFRIAPCSVWDTVPEKTLGSKRYK